MTGIITTQTDAERTLVRLATCVERAGKMATLKLLVELGVRLEADRVEQEREQGKQEK